MSQFNREMLADCMEEIKPILRHEHWEEVGHYRDIPIDMEWDKYKQLEAAGVLRCYVIRSPVNEEFKESLIVGYAFFFVNKHLHYKHTTVASQDILYVRKPYRGIGKSFLEWCDNHLKDEGVITVTHHIKPWFDWSSMAEKLGYEKAETIYSRRIG